MTTALQPRSDRDAYDRLAALADKFATGRKSPRTARSYRTDIIGCSHPLGHCDHDRPERDHRLTAWLPWCARNGHDPLSVRHSDVSIWLSDLALKGEAPGTRARRLAAVSSWYRWLIREQIATFNPADLDSQERPQRRAPGTFGKALSNEQAKAIVKSADDNGERAAAVIAFMIYTGARVTEVISANVEDVHQDRGQLVVTLRGKGDKERLAPIVPIVYARIDRYATVRPDTDQSRLPTLSAGALPQRPLFATETGRRLDRAYVSRLVTRLGERIGVPRLTPHDLRRTFATIALDEKVALRDLQDAMGHADPRTTRSYDRSRNSVERHPAFRLAAALGDE